MSIWIASNAVIFGDVRFKEGCSVYYHTVIRAESGTISFGERTNIQDLCVIHGGKTNPVTVGSYVTIGHRCIIHGCTIGDNTLIGMGSIIMNNAVIGNNCIIGAGSLVTEGTVIPDNSVAYGSPCRIIRSITQEESDSNTKGAMFYEKIKPLHQDFDERKRNE